MATDLTNDLKKYGLSLLAFTPLPIAVLQLESLYFVANLGILAGVGLGAYSIVKGVLNYRQTYRKYQQLKRENGLGTGGALMALGGMIPLYIGVAFFAYLLPAALIHDGPWLVMFGMSLLFGVPGLVLVVKGFSTSDLVGDNAEETDADVENTAPVRNQ